MIKKIFAPGNNSGSANFALLVLRVWIGLEMLLLHGLDKLMHFNKYAPKFVDLLGIGSKPSLALSIFAEVVASALLVLGLWTRFGALVLVINMGVAFSLAHGGKLTGEHNGEMAFVYLMAYVTLLLAGGGKISMDGMLFGKAAGKSKPAPPKKK